MFDNLCNIEPRESQGLAWVSGVSGEKGKDGSEKGKAWYSG